MPHNPFQESIIEYFQKYYKKHKKAPSTRQIFKDFSKAKFYRNFPNGVGGACKIAGIPVPEASIKRMEKALQASKKKRVAEATKQGSPWEDLKQSYKREEDERRLRKQKSEELAKQVRKLATDPNKEISGPILDALSKVLPKILKRRYDVSHDLGVIINIDKQISKLEENGVIIEPWRLYRCVSEWRGLPEDMKKLLVALYNFSRYWEHTLKDTLVFLDLRFHSSYYESPEEFEKRFPSKSKQEIAEKLKWEQIGPVIDKIVEELEKPKAG